MCIACKLQTETCFRQLLGNLLSNHSVLREHFSKRLQENRVIEILLEKCIPLNWFLRISFVRCSPPEVFLGKDVLKICCKFTRENKCRSVISIKLLSNFIEVTLRHRCSPEHFWRAASDLYLENFLPLFPSRSIFHTETKMYYQFLSFALAFFHLLMHQNWMKAMVTFLVFS